MTMPKTNNLIIETQDLEFGFNAKQRILKDLNLKVEKGSIYGFLGPNGAGKTTTIRLLLGLLHNPKNTVRLFGRKLAENRLEIFSKIGSLIEQPSLYEHISGYDNLEITRQIRNVNKQRVAEVLRLVKLSGAAHKKVKAYSLGMKQRLGLAIALLGEPELLILDEPVNGLDPNGMVEIRELLKNINKELGTTIFLSSHLLSEIEKIVTHIGIINIGELLFQGTILELRNLQINQSELRIETSDNKAALEKLQYKWNMYEEQMILKVSYQSKEQTAQIIRDLTEMNIDVYQVVVESKDLEELFLQMTENYTVS
ncbi:MAG: transporter ATP-binding protein [Segetibacter sp.]|nr:transporter ATP-binding protein [Segetibacter sp.]